MKPRYEDACRTFTWDASLRALGWTRADPVSLGHTIVDRHAGAGPGGGGAARVALRWFGKDGTSQTLTFAELARLSDRFANLLRAAGCEPGDRVAGFLPRVPASVVAMLGTWKAGGVWVPIFTAFGADAIAFRVRHSGARILCTHGEHRARVPAAVGAAARIVTMGAPAGVAPGDLDFWQALAAQPERCEPAPRRRDDPAVILYTSGSTGPPKGVQIATNFVLAIHPYMRYAVDLRADDVFWPTGDPGWGYGLVCYMLALALGVAVVSHEASPAPEFCLERLSALGVTNLATTPTLLRGIMALGPEVVGRYPVRLRAVSSCGEPLNAEVVAFFERHWGVTAADQYGSSEFGLPVGNLNAVAMAVKPGSMGLPLPGCRMAIVDEDGREAPPDRVGQIALWPDPVGYYALGYWGDAERTRALDRGGWLTIGDLGRRDRDGYFWFEGRADDVIKSAGYRIGPFEVESALLHHPAVAEAAVVGKPDALRGHIVKAYVVLKPGASPAPALADEMVEVVRARVGRHQAPREVEFVAELPKTESGKIQRFVLRGRAG
jgi:acetyl-CoA synthetase